MTTLRVIKELTVQSLTSESFQRFGQVIWAVEDGKPYGCEDAQLDLSLGIPRFYAMRLHYRGRKLSRITRHLRCTQCLGSMAGKDWLIAVAPPLELDNPQAKPKLEQIEAFLIPGNCFIKLHVGTWHAGPYFDADFVNFYNLELSDTNIVDHHTCHLSDTYGTEILLV